MGVFGSKPVINYMQPYEPSLVTLDMYLSGECSMSDSQNIEAWLAADPARREMLQDMARVQAHLSSEPTWDLAVMKAEFDKNNFLGSVEKQTGLAQHMTTVARQTQTPQYAQQQSKRESRTISGRYISRMMIGFGAVVGLALVTLTAVNRYSGTSTSLVQATSSHTVTTVRGQRVEVKLPDGTHAIVGPDSRLVYSEDDKSTVRTVSLQGEAVFTVVQSVNKPFVIRTDESNIRVLGTTFGVRQYADDSATTVTVLDGRVAVDYAVSTQAEPIVLSAGHSARIMQNGKMIINRKADTASVAYWMKGKLEFYMIPLHVVIGDVSRFYDIDLKIASNQLRDQLVTVGISDTQTPTEMIAMLADIAGARVERHGNTFTFYAK